MTGPEASSDKAWVASESPAATKWDLVDLLRVVSSRRWLILGTVALFVLVTGALTLVATPYYRAKVRVLIERHNANPTAFQDIYQLGTGTDDYYTTQYKILESRAVAEAALALLSDADRATYVKGPQGSATDEFMRLRQIAPVVKSRLVDVVADHPDPAVAARAVQAIVQAYVDNGLDRLENASSEALRKLKRDAEDLQKKVLTAELAVQEFRRKNEIVTTGDRRSLVATRLEKLTEELAEIERSRGEAMARLRSGVPVEAAANSDDLPEVLDSLVIANCKRALLDARAERSSLLQNYKAQHPRMLAIDSKIAAVEDQLRREVDLVYRGLQRQVERAERREADVRARIDEQKKALLELEGKNSEHDILVDEAAATRKLHDTVLARLKEVQLIHGAEQTNVHRIGTAETSGRPVRPDRLLNLVMALFGGLLAAGMLAFTVELLDRTVKTEEDAQRTLELPTLGTVPRLTGERPDDGRLDPETLDERSQLSEAFRTLRTSLAFSGRTRDLRSVVVTSAAPSEGKSLVAINLAVAFARTGKKVLLVDADMRRPRLHRAFGIRPEEGFSSLLLGSRALPELVLATPVANLSLLPCGVIPPNPVELLGGGGMPTALQAILAAFDLVVFDAPPVGLVSDASVLGTLAEQVLFIVRSCRTNRVNARRAVAKLRATGCTVTGTVLNNSELRARRYEDYGSEYSYQPHPEDVADDEPVEAGSR